MKRRFIDGMVLTGLFWVGLAVGAHIGFPATTLRIFGAAALGSFLTLLVDLIINWRRGGAKGAREGSAGELVELVTRHDGAAVEPSVEPNILLRSLLCHASLPPGFSSEWKPVLEDLKRRAFCRWLTLPQPAGTREAPALQGGGGIMKEMSRKPRGECLTTLVVGLALTGCALIPQSAPRISHRAYCRQAAQFGWCSPSCGRRQPALCRKLKLLSCSDWMCKWLAEDGSLVFSADLGRHPAVLRGCRYLWQDETTSERVWDCGGGNRCSALPGRELACYRTPPSGAAVVVVDPPGCGGGL